MIASMKYLSIICMKEDREKLLAALQKCVILQCGIERAADAAAPVVGQWSRRQSTRAELVPF